MVNEDGGIEYKRELTNRLKREIVSGSYDGITDKLFDIIHHKGAFYYGN
ncbi:hypothetical protein [Latilactobacillus curvatus]